MFCSLLKNDLQGVTRAKSASGVKKNKNNYLTLFEWIDRLII